MVAIQKSQLRVLCEVGDGLRIKVIVRATEHPAYMAVHEAFRDGAMGI